MQKADSSDLFDELDAALQSGLSEKRLAMLRQVTDLFLKEADRLDEEQIGVFDNVLVQLIAIIESKALMEISERLATVANAPIDLTVKLASHSEIGIARPILKNPSRLTTADLVAIAKTKSHGRTRESQDGIRKIFESERSAAASVLAGPRGEREERLRPCRGL